MTHYFGWTPDRVSRLTDLWGKGLSARLIGIELGITRNAVLGKAHRIGLDPRQSPIKNAKPYGEGQGRARDRKRLEKAQILGRQDESERDYQRPLPKLSRNPGDKCQWIEGEPRHRNFCNSRTVEGTSWCPEHRAKVFLPAKAGMGGTPDGAILSKRCAVPPSVGSESPDCSRGQIPSAGPDDGFPAMSTGPA